MVDPNHPLCELLKRDGRYRFDAYVFVFESLRYAQEKLGMGASPERADEAYDSENSDSSWEQPPEGQRHVSGQELCEAMRIYAVEQFGYLAKSVLNHWGIHATSDFGEIVFNLIDVEQMRKTPEDRREDFDDVYDFDDAFQYSFQFTSADSSEEPRL